MRFLFQQEPPVPAGVGAAAFPTGSCTPFLALLLVPPLLLSFLPQQVVPIAQAEGGQRRRPHLPSNSTGHPGLSMLMFPSFKAPWSESNQNSPVLHLSPFLLLSASRPAFVPSAEIINGDFLRAPNSIRPSTRAGAFTLKIP